MTHPCNSKSILPDYSIKPSIEKFNIKTQLKIAAIVLGILAIVGGTYLSFTHGLGIPGIVTSTIGLSISLTAIWSIRKESKKEIRNEPVESEEKSSSLSDALQVWINEGPENEKKNRIDAGERIFKCYEEKKTDLNLSNLALTSLFPEIKILNQLTFLDLTRNKLCTLPHEIGMLKQLNALGLDDNKLSYLPPEINALSQLNTLRINNNNLRYLLPEIGALKNLRSLSLHNNNLSSLPPQIGDLKRLSKLELGKNNLFSLPPEFGKMSQLQRLDLTDNNLSALPPQIGDLNELFILHLSSNNLSSLPNEILNLSSNCTVDLAGNPFSITVIEQYQQIANSSGYDCPTITFSMHSNVQKSNLSLDQLFQDLCKIVEKDPIPLIKLKDNDELHSLLSRLVDVSNYNQSQIKLALSNMIYNDFLNTFKLCILGASTTCGDRVALSLLKLGINLRIKKCLENGDLKELIYLLGHGSMALDILEKFATEKIATLKMVDPIEVHLAYPIMLREKLNMPLDVLSMLFFGISGVTEEDLARAEKHVRKLLSDKQHYINFLIEQDDWKKGLSKHKLTKDEYLAITAKKDSDSENAKSSEDWIRIEIEFKEFLYKRTEEVLEKNLPSFLR